MQHVLGSIDSTDVFPLGFDPCALSAELEASEGSMIFCYRNDGMPVEMYPQLGH